MNQHQPIPNKHFLFWWIAASIAVWPASIFIGAVTGVSISILITFATELGLESFPVISAFENLESVATVTFLGGVVGYAIGLLQQSVFRRQLYWEIEGWRRVSTIGGIIGGVAVALTALPIVNSTSDPIPVILTTAPLYLLCVSGLQYILLRQATRFASLWILANIIAGIIVISLIVQNPIQRYDMLYPLKVVGVFALIGIAPGAITGIMIAQLYQRYAYAVATNEEAEIPASVWDEAI